MFCADVVDFVTPLKKRRLARESLSIDGSLRSISEEEDSLSARTASPPDAMPPSGTVSAAEPELTSAVSTNECLSQVRILYSCFCGHRISLRQLPKSAGEVFFTGWMLSVVGKNYHHGRPTCHTCLLSLLKYYMTVKIYLVCSYCYCCLAFSACRDAVCWATRN